MPLRLKPLLRKEFPQIDFAEFDPTENFPEDADIYMIDTVQGIDIPRTFKNIDRFINKKGVSMHDFDLAWEMKLMKKAGKLGNITIFGVPPKGDIQEIFNKLKLLIS